MTPVPGTKWLLSIYARVVASRLDETKARITSIFGSILKMDSTKKVIKKLAGAAAGTAAWVTNVGNEHGQILISVLTAAEGAGLHPMATGLMRRYRDASVSPPLVLYVDRDCCSHGGPCKVSLLFNQWDQLVVRLDVWHLMRRFAAGVTTESHPLYSLFMARLSFCIFEWDQGDVARLRQAKAGEAGNDPRGSGYGKIPLKELARHCRRRTRGAEETGRLIDEMLEAFGDATDTMGIPLLGRAKIQEIWKTQRRHLHCIQDPPGVHLYMQTGQLVKGGITLPVFRCGRGSTSLESFHLHLDRFIPGKGAQKPVLCDLCCAREWVALHFYLCVSLSLSLTHRVFQALQPARPTFRPICWKAWHGGTRTVRQKQWRKETVISSATVANSSTPSTS
ncbi:uncharacterized protein LOC127526673 [Erpetoichthys calabaricus]|uniref:uncharacterized protein LOC127526673 n=1 Tax=Erpetoichthys calabaricus TaxID=27687 RepID=UPI002234781A|nr:uncharacterized protein LOC127526673 [Erpetoichthys calabaricus]